MIDDDRNNLYYNIVVVRTCHIIVAIPVHVTYIVPDVPIIILIIIICIVTIIIIIFDDDVRSGPLWSSSLWWKRVERERSEK